LIRVAHYSSILQAFDDSKGVLYLSLNLVIANIILSIPLTMLWGIKGTALSTLIANIYNWIMMLRRISGHLDLKIYQVLPFGYYFRVLGVATAVGFLVWWSRFTLFAANNTLIGLAWSICTFFVLFGIVGSLTNVIGSDDWEKLRNWLSFKFLR